MATNWWDDPYARYNSGAGADWAHLPVAAHPLPLKYTDVPYSGAVQDWLGGGGGRFGTPPPVDTGPGGPRPSTPSGTILPPGGMVARPTPDQLTGAQVARPTAEQLQGGHTMVAPPMGSGMATGATAANPTPGYGPAQSAGAPGGFGAANLAYSQDPATWALNYARAHGHVPGQGHTQMGDFLQKLWTNMATAIFGLSPDLATLDPTAAMNNILYGGANTMYGNAAGFADQAFGGLQGKMGQMDESKQWELMNAYDALKTMGRNKYWQNARENQLSGGLEQYKLKQQQLAAAGQEQPPDLWSFIMGQPGINDYGR